ncbi:hypothetical protein L218DRAFT_1078233, partial [Marasmius fiardii PR-910]
MLFRLPRPRFFSTERAFTPERRTNIVLNRITTPTRLATVLDKVQVGPIERAHHEPKTSRAYIDFIEPESSRLFYDRLQEMSEELDVGCSLLKKYSRPKASVVAAIGTRTASRCITIYPIPPSTQNYQLREDLSRFGLVEKVEINENRRGICSATVHFYSIESALEASLALRKEEGTKNSRIKFGVDRFDFSFEAYEKELQEYRKAVDARTVILSDYGNDFVKALKLVERVIGPLQVHGEALKSMMPELSSKLGGERVQRIKLTFMRAADATRFMRIYNSQLVPIWSGLKAKLAPPSRLRYHHLFHTRAVRLGATRRLVISNIQDRERINHKNVLEDFLGFGRITNMYFPEKENCAFVSFTHVLNAMNAINFFHAHRKILYRYHGTQISFYQHPSSNIPPTLPVSIYCDRGQGSTASPLSIGVDDDLAETSLD